MSDTHEKELAHDRLAERFDTLMNAYDISRRLEELIDVCLKDVPLAGRLTLDAGCGTGRGTQRLSEKGAKVVALDLGTRLTRYTANRYPCVPVVGSILELPFDDRTFDIVFSSEVIEHTPDPLQAAQELYRVLRPGGHLVLSTPGWLWQTPVRIATRLGLRPYKGLENFVTASALRRALEQVGAQVLVHRGIHLLPFQITPLHPVIRYCDRFGVALLPLMINQIIHCTKPA